MLRGRMLVSGSNEQETVMAQRKILTLKNLLFNLP